MAALDTTVPLRGLAPGPHVLTVTTRVGNGKPASREVPFQIK